MGVLIFDLNGNIRNRTAQGVGQGDEGILPFFPQGEAFISEPLAFTYGSEMNDERFFFAVSFALRSDLFTWKH